MGSRLAMKAAPRISESGGSIWSHAPLAAGERKRFYMIFCANLWGITLLMWIRCRLLQLLYPENNYARRLIYVKFAQQVVRAAGCGDAVAVSILEEAGELGKADAVRIPPLFIGSAGNAERYLYESSRTRAGHC